MSKVAAIQMCSSYDVDSNLALASQLIGEAAENGAHFVVLPEMFAIMGKNAIDKVLVKEHIGEGKIQSFLSNEAKKNGLWIIGGTIPITCENPKKIRAASLAFNEKGETVARYDKIHLFDVTLSENEIYKESDTTEPGSDVIVINTPIGKLGLAVCYDVRFPDLFRNLVNKGAEIITLPSAFTVKTGKAHWELLARSKAVENFCYIIVDPWGDILAIKEDNSPGIIYANIDLEYLKKVRASIPALEHQKILNMQDD